MKVTVHVGPTKTGSTALQKSLAANRKLLRKHGILYPITRDKGFNHNILLAGLKHQRQIPRLVWHDLQSSGETPAQCFQREAAFIARQIRRHRPAHIILSSEGLFRKPTQFVPEFWTALLADFEFTLDYVAYVRDPAKRLVSSAQQRLRHSHRLKLSADHLRMGPVLAAIEAAGPVRLKCFDRIRAEAIDLARDFLADIAPDLPTNRFNTPPANETMSAEAMVVLQDYRAALHAESANEPRGDVRQLLRQFKALGEMGGNVVRPRLRAAVERQVYAALAADIDWLAERYTIDLSACIDRRVIDADPGGELDLQAIDSAAHLCEVDPARVDWLRHRIMQRLLQTERKKRPR